ncbi:hypothetical protein L873DRAFT_1815888 [Choiromyces venosus 120613-1]|uniref:Uncharacterized protein n=1 Tax=Choiromyces venosus 120613-1 TaxID=1336337 RepID=A0A3N4J543_9PEZI|nr:hypothetical protein L873DRAFT_1815888 [Choiromyces venosus 120613-1]
MPATLNAVPIAHPQTIAAPRCRMHPTNLAGVLGPVDHASFPPSRVNRFEILRWPSSWNRIININLLWHNRHVLHTIGTN